MSEITADAYFAVVMISSPQVKILAQLPNPKIIVNNNKDTYKLFFILFFF
jgi:predicted metalloenzyme YecM